MRDHEGGSSLHIADDGRGVDDPASFVTLGRSGWSDEIAQREDPAGMGVFSLAGRTVTVRSFSRVADEGWAMTIPADAWEGTQPLAVESCRIRAGTEIIIAMPKEWLCNLRAQVEAAARHFPLPIHFHGELLPREDFLEGAHRVEEWNGCRIGIFRGSYDLVNEPRINFHGVKVACRLPSVKEVDASYPWTARIDIVDAPSLQLVLPARKEVVDNAALGALRAAVQTAIYRTIGSEGSHRLSFQNWQRAADLGIELPEASAWLYEWRPCTADDRGGAEGARIEAVPMILVPDHDADIEQCAAPLLTEDRLGLRAVRAEDAFSGYTWYDGLPRVTGLSFATEIDGRQIHYADGDVIFPDILSGRVPMITLEVPVVRCAASDEPIVTLCFPVDMLVCANGGTSLDETHVFVREGASIAPAALAQKIEDCCFAYDEDCISDSWRTQQRDFERDARKFANELLLGADEALAENIRAVFAEEVQWMIPIGRRLTLEAHQGDVRVALTANDADPEITTA
ncbi:ATP-binding protein [Sphingopyxis sp.]|uniref:ATP-binding protein n=1 Tax=Sphingopyxis sp. TaxID=1908224 RepID=UPI0025D3521B|nr:ATP-binding protein [Sphingopyxis sp.]